MRTFLGRTRSSIGARGSFCVGTLRRASEDSMRRLIPGISMLLLLQAPEALQASELRVLLPAPVRPFVEGAATEFQSHRPDARITIENAPGLELVKKVNAGGKYDIV